jgi:DNA-binding NarL/FixJ family response regulator
MTKTKILLVDDHPVIRFGLVTLLEQQEVVEIVAVAEGGQDALDKLEQHKDIELVIMDIKMPDMDGIEATQAIDKKYPNIVVLALSMYDEQDYISKMLEAGASGYILKNSSSEEIMKAVRMVMAGENYFSSRVLDMMVSEYLREKGVANTTEPEEVVLTEREKDILKLIAEEKTSIEIGEALEISQRTVDTHRRNLIDKLDCKNTAGLVKFAIKKGYANTEK